MIRTILKKIGKWLLYLIMFIFVVVALVSIKQDQQHKHDIQKNDPIHRINDDMLQHHTGDTMYVSYDSRDYDDYIVDRIIKDMNQRGYNVVNKYVERLQYQGMNYDFIYIREYTVTHVIYRK